MSTEGTQKDKYKIKELKKREKQVKKEIEILKQEFAEMEEAVSKKDEKIEELNDRLLRTMAEFDNFKKRMNRDREIAIRFSNENFILALLPVLDHFDSALTSIREQSGNESIKVGVEMIYNELVRTLKAEGLEQINEKDVKFDSNIHEAVEVIQIELAEGEKDDFVEKLLRNGYKYKGKLLRPAAVVVTKIKEPSKD